jgi:hypothetical protein
MSVPSKKVTSSNDFFTEKVKLEEALIDFEKLILEGNDYLEKIEQALSTMQILAEENKSAYFLQRVKKLHVFFHTLRLRKGYSKEDFDPMYHILEKIKNEDRIEFLDSALKNRISKVARSLTPSPVKRLDRQLDLKDKEIFTAFKTGGVHFLVSKKPYRILKNIPAFKSRLTLNGKRIPLFPGPGFLIDDEGVGLKKDVILMQTTATKKEGFYFDELLEDWAISKASIMSITRDDKANQKILGKIRRKGINYHIIRLA